MRNKSVLLLRWGLLGLALAEENCDVISLRERDESLESYYVSLIGGQKND